MPCRVLIVDDDVDKVRVLSEAILQTDGFKRDDLKHVIDVRSAKQALAEKKYDLLILDINLPRTADKGPEVGAGLAVLSYLKNNRKSINPSYILGMTSFDDGFAAAINDFSSPLWKLIKFSFSDNSWKEPLQSSLKYLIDTNKPPYYNDGSTYHVDVAVALGLEGIELEALLAQPGEWKELRIDHDPSSYYEGTIKCGTHNLSIVALAASKMGLPSAAVAASKLISAFRPRYLAMTGICAGVRKKVKLGDILVADPCFDWGNGKWKSDPKTKQLKFLPAPYQWRLDEDIRSAIKRCAKQPGLLEEIRNSYSGKKPSVSPSVEVEAMASGGSVLQSQVLMDGVGDQHKNLIGVEMESYAVFTAAANAAAPRPLCFSIKSVCDFGDDKKKDGYQGYAAHTSTRFFWEFAANYLTSRDPTTE